MSEEPSTRITLRHVYAEQQEMKNMLQALASHLPNVAQKLEQHERETGEILKDHENRLRQLETKLWKLFGAIALIAASAPFLARLIEL
jgi:ferritin-like metal-binding protein YciE